MIIQFDLGDWSGDGHEKGFPVFVESSHTSDEIAAAYARACQDLDFVLHARVCYDHEDRMISTDDLAFLIDRLGYQPQERDGVAFDPDWVTAEDVFDMFLHFVRHGDPEFVMTIWEPDETFFRGGVKGRNFGLAYGTF